MGIVGAWDIIEGNITGEYTIIYCFAFEFGHCFQSRSPVLKSKAAPAFHTLNWQGILNIFSLKNKGDRVM